MRFRPSSESLGVHVRAYSRALQRVVCDFGADHAFGQVAAKLYEHYGITLPASSARTITEYHAQRIREKKEWDQAVLPASDCVIGECDGSMIPLVETLLPASQDIKQDGRRHKQLYWKEARLSLAHAKGSTTPYIAATLGTVKEAGQQLLTCVQQAGAHEKTQIHCVGDGAPWIVNQVEEQFGARGSYLIDFYHVCEYLHAAALHCAPAHTEEWLKHQKARLKLSCHKDVVAALHPHVEPTTVKDTDAPVRACYRYLSNRPTQLDYKKAQDAGLPIGSGEVESAHRYILQARLKLSGAWWHIDQAKNMIALRTCRVNKLWNSYWASAA